MSDRDDITELIIADAQMAQNYAAQSTVRSRHGDVGGSAATGP
ncbi:MAG: hypothetical protein ACUVSY_02975 [Roseiflexus sp.]